MREVVNTIMRRAAGDEAPELAPYYEDLYDHTLRAAEWTESLRDMITSIFETNMSLADAHMNLIMKKLTSWAAIIAVPTAVTGWFGQNVPYPGFGHESGFVFSVALIVVIAARAVLDVQAQGLAVALEVPRPGSSQTARMARLGSVPVKRFAAASRSGGTTP